jgi:hypothetical protein
MVDVKAPGIAVVIGAWEDHVNPIVQQCLENIVTFIDNSPAINTIILSGNHVKLDETNEGLNQWHTQARRIFLDEQGVDWVRRHWVVPKPQPFATVASLVKDHVWENKTCISIWEQWHLEYLLNHVAVDQPNIWYFGIGLGVRRDPIGWGHLSDLIRYQHVRELNVLSKQNCMLINSLDHLDFKQATFTKPEFDTNGWCLVHNDIYVKLTRDWNPEIPNGY